MVGMEILIGNAIYWVVLLFIVMCLVLTITGK